MTMCIFKCNPIVTSGASLISISNVPFCASLYRSRNTLLEMPVVETSVAHSVALTNARSSVLSIATLDASFGSPSRAL